MFKKVKQIPCDVCDTINWADETGYADCINCGWRISNWAREEPDRAGINNIPSLNSAKKLYKEGKPLIGTFEDFIGAFEFYGEVQFTYKNMVYGLTRFGDDGVSFFESGTTEQVKLRLYEANDLGDFETVEDFMLNAKINGVLLKDLWHSVTETDFLQ